MNAIIIKSSQYCLTYKDFDYICLKGYYKKTSQLWLQFWKIGMKPCGTRRL